MAIILGSPDQHPEVYAITLIIDAVVEVVDRLRSKT